MKVRGQITIREQNKLGTIVSQHMPQPEVDVRFTIDRKIIGTLASKMEWKARK